MGRPWKQRTEWISIHLCSSFGSSRLTTSHRQEAWQKGFPALRTVSATMQSHTMQEQCRWKSGGSRQTVLLSGSSPLPLMLLHLETGFLTHSFLPESTGYWFQLHIIVWFWAKASCLSCLLIKVFNWLRSQLKILVDLHCLLPDCKQVVAPSYKFRSDWASGSTRHYWGSTG